MILLLGTVGTTSYLIILFLGLQNYNNKLLGFCTYFPRYLLIRFKM